MNTIFKNASHLALSCALAGLLSACGSSSDSSGAPPPATPTTAAYSAVLAGAQENPPVLTASAGSAAFTLDTTSNLLTGTVTTTDLTGIAAHIHLAEPGLNGGVIIPLAESATGSGVWNVPAATTLTAAQVSALNAGGLYVNVHSQLNPGGQIRGQIGRLVQTARLTGSQENPPTGSTASGSGVFSVDRITRALTARVVTTGMTGTVAHMHTAAIGANGGVAVAFSETAAGSGIWVPSTPTVLTEAQYLSFIGGGMYMNVHSATNPGGEIRGQIGLDVYDVTMVGAQEVPPVVGGGTATARVIVNPTTRELTGSINNVSVSANNGHLHGGVYGVSGGVVVPATISAAGSPIWNFAPTNLSAAQYRALLHGNWYANSHSAANPGGEARGQIGNVVRTGLMAGSNEVPANSSTAGGRATAALDPNTLDIAVTMVTTGLSATAAHLHIGAVGANGGVIVPLTEGPVGTWRSAAGAKLTQAQAVAFAAGGTYFNAHTPAFPGGEIRGQAAGLD